MSQSAPAGGQHSRRDFLRLAGAGAATAAAAGAGIGSIPSTASAIPAFPTGPTTTASYFTRQLDNITGGQTVEPGSSTPEAIAESWWRTGMYAIEHDKWAIDQIWNTLEDAQTPAYVRAKTAALEAIADGQTKQDVVDVALEKVDDHYAMVQSNFLEHWQAQVNKAFTYYKEADNHSEIDSPEMFSRLRLEFSTTSGAADGPGIKEAPLEQIEEDVTLADGSVKTITRIAGTTPNSDWWPGLGYNFEGHFEASPTGYSTEIYRDGEDLGEESFVSAYYSWRIPGNELDGDVSTHNAYWFQFVPSEQDTGYTGQDTLPVSGRSTGPYLSQYMVLWERILDQHSMVSDNIETAVVDHYSSVTYGDKTVEELVAADPYVLAQEWSTDYDTTGHLAYAAADLAVLGLSFDSDNRMAFELDDGTTLEGTLYLSEEDEEFEHDVGVQIDPAARQADFYIAADTATMSRPLPADDYRDEIDGGEAKLNVSVVEDTQYVIETAHDESVSVAWDAWEIEDTVENEDVMLRRNADSLVVDLSDELEQPITSIESITHTYYGDDDAMVMAVDQPFTITEAYDVETGEEVDTVTGQGYNPRDTDLDFDWTDSYLDMRDNTDDYAQSSGGGGGGGGIGFDFGGVDLGGLGSGVAGAIAAGLQLLLLGALGVLGYDLFISDS